MASWVFCTDSQGNRVYTAALLGRYGMKVTVQHDRRWRGSVTDMLESVSEDADPAMTLHAALNSAIRTAVMMIERQLCG